MRLMKSAVLPQPAQRNVSVNMQAREIDSLEPDSINLLIFLLSDFHLCKSATLEQTNSAELSGPSDEQIAYQWLRSAPLTVSGLDVMAAHNIQPEYPPRRVAPSHNEKIKFRFFSRRLCVKNISERKVEMKGNIWRWSLEKQINHLPRRSLFYLFIYFS